MTDSNADNDNFAAVDLGSNSFHLVIARLAGGSLQFVDRLKEPVRLAAGLDADGRLEPAAIQRAVDCLDRFGQRLQDITSDRVRAVGTNTLRKAKNNGQVQRDLESALGHTIEIIPGREEARLIYLGVAHGLAKLTAGDAAAYDVFGVSVSIYGNYVIAGAFGNDDNGNDSGSAYIFERSGGSWNQVAKLIASDGTTHDYFAYIVSISDDYVIVGAHQDDDNGADSGSAYIYRKITVLPFLFLLD